MVRIFEKARRWHDPGSETCGMTLLLQVTPNFCVITHFRRVHFLFFGFDFNLI